MQYRADIWKHLCSVVAIYLYIQKILPEVWRHSSTWFQNFSDNLLCESWDLFFSLTNEITLINLTFFKLPVPTNAIATSLNLDSQCIMKELLKLEGKLHIDLVWWVSQVLQFSTLGYIKIPNIQTVNDWLKASIFQPFLLGKRQGESFLTNHLPMCCWNWNFSHLPRKYLLDRLEGYVIFF